MKNLCGDRNDRKQDHCIRAGGVDLCGTGSWSADIFAHLRHVSFIARDTKVTGWHQHLLRGKFNLFQMVSN
jgi:hypothetical protein